MNKHNTNPLDRKLSEILLGISPLDEDAMLKASAHQAILAKPPGSLGMLEDISVRLSGITGKVKNEIRSKRIIVLCADNGVTAEGVSCTPQYVTAVQAANMTRHLTGMSAMAKYFRCDVVVADLGIVCPYSCPEVLDCRVANGTKNIVSHPAMTREEAQQAVLMGIRLAEEAKRDHVDLIGVGEMGIGNTTTSSAVLSALTAASVEEVTGRGGGLTDEAFEKKKNVITRALELHRPDPLDPIDVLSKVGGLDLAAMCGVFLGAARCRIPVVIDGFISVVAALCAARLSPAAANYMFPSHASYERGYVLASECLGLRPWLLLGIRLGEGSGCPLAFQVIEAACAVMSGMATFEEASINDEYLDEIRKKDCFGV